MNDKKLVDANQTNFNSQSDKVDGLHRLAYARSKGVNTKEPLQLNLLFTKEIGTRNDLRHIPNDYARSSLFTVRSKRVQRKVLLQQTLFHYNEHVTITFSGIELRAEDDEIVWLQILNYAQNLPLGSPLEFTVKELVSDVGWSKSGPNYRRVRECISRLKANEVMAKNTKAYGSSGAISLIHNYEVVNDTEGTPTKYRVWIDPAIIVLFAGNTFTSHSWLEYRNLSAVARRLADYIESHKEPYPLDSAKFKKICGSDDASTTSWRQTVKRACAEVVAANIVSLAMLDKQDRICCQGKK